MHYVIFESHLQFFAPGFVRLARWTSRYSVRRAALLFSVSAFSRAEMARCYGIDAAWVDITFNGVDTRRFRLAAPADSIYSPPPRHSDRNGWR